MIAILVFGVFAFYKGDSILQTYQQNKATQLEAQLQQTQQQAAAALQAAADAKAQVAQVQQAAAQDRATAAAIIQAVTAQNAALNKAMSDRDKQTQQQQQIDLSASIPELGKRFLALVPNLNPADIKVADDQKTVTLGQDTVQKTAAQLELVPQLQQDKKDLQTEVDNANRATAGVQKALDSESKLADALISQVATEQKYSALLVTQVGQSDKLCNDKIGVEKTKAKKSWLKGFFWGNVSGFFGGLFTGHAVGL